MNQQKEVAYLVNETEDSILVKITGRASYLNCQPLNNYLLQALKRSCKKFCFYFEDCIAIDSTCLGILAGVALKADVCIFKGVPKRPLESIRQVGLDSLVQIVEGNADSKEILHQMESQKASNEINSCKREEILKAHQLLVEIDQQNRMRFKDVLQLLENENK